MTDHHNGRLAIVWAPDEARTAMYAERLHAKLCNVHYLGYKRPLFAPFKYPAQWLKTLQILFREKPRVVYVTNPPVFAAWTVALYGFFSGAQFVMDTHSPALYMWKWEWSVPLQRIAARWAKLNIVDQERFKALFESWGAKAVVLERPPKQIDTSTLKLEPNAEWYDIAVVNTFAVDEPLEPILDAARELPDVRFLVMGDLKLAKPGLVQSAPKNVVFTDYLRKDAYWTCLYNAQAVMTLTTFPHSLLGGAQDGVALRKPLLISRQPALTEYFYKGAVFVEHTAASIVVGVKEVRVRQEALVQEVGELAIERAERWNRAFAEVEKAFGGS